MTRMTRTTRRRNPQTTLRPLLATLLLMACALATAGCMGAPDATTGTGAPDGSMEGSSGIATTGPGGASGAPQGTQATQGQAPAGQTGASATSPPSPSGGPAGNAVGPAAVHLGSAAGYAILAKAGVSATGTTTVVGDIGVSPITASAVTGFGLVMDASNQFATSSLVTGQVRAADHAPPTPAALTQAVADMGTAYADAAGRSNPTATELGAGNIAGMTIGPGLYKWGTGLTMPGDVVLSGGSNDVWIFQVAQGLDLGTGADIVLSGGAQARNVYWQVAGQATLASGSHFQGTILSYNAIVLETGARLDGRALAQTAVTLDANAVTRSA